MGVLRWNLLREDFSDRVGRVATLHKRRGFATLMRLLVANTQQGTAPCYIRHALAILACG